MPFYTDNLYKPDLPNDFNPFEKKEPSAKTNPINVQKLKRPKFPESVRSELEKRVKPTPQVQLNEYPVLFYGCGACGLEGEGHLMHIGHIVTWKDYLEEKGPLSMGAALAAYCDLNNLRFEHAICNTSHQFEDGPVGNGGDIFTGLINKYGPPSKDVTCEKVQVGNKEVVLPAARTKHGVKLQNTEFDFDEDDRPQFYPGTRDALVAAWYKQGLARIGQNSKGATVPLFFCVSCRKDCEAFSMQLGHKVKWETYAKSCNAESRADVIQAFNDLNNLEFQCGSCNQGHEWEEWDPNSEDFRYTDEEILEKNSAEEQVSEDIASYIEQQLQIDSPIFTQDQQAILHLLVSLHVVGEELPKLPKFSAMAKAIPDIIFLSSEALKQRLAIGYANSMGQQEALQLGEINSRNFQNKIVTPVLDAWNEDTRGKANPLDSQQIDAFRTALFCGKQPPLPDPVTLFGRQVKVDDILNCGALFKKVITKSHQILESYETFPQHMKDAPVDLSATVPWVQGFKGLPPNATKQNF